jgi:capsular polysaccharide biosynthesis protein
MYHLKGVYLVGKEAWPYFSCRKLFEKSVSYYSPDLRRIKRPVKFLQHRERQTVFHLTGPNAGNKGHFLIEYLPRLIVGEHIIKEMSACKVLLLANRGLSHLPIIHKVNESIPSLEHAQSAKGTIYCNNLLYIPPLAHNRDQLLGNPDVYLKIKTSVTKNTRIENTDKACLFISRKDAPDRRLLNEDDVFRLLSFYWPDLHPIMLSRYTFDEQVNLFRNARVIIGPHGQPFRNTLYTDNCLQIQMHYGYDINHKWCVAYNCIANISGSNSIAIYSGHDADASGDWIYPINLLKKQILFIRQIYGYS